MEMFVCGYQCVEICVCAATEKLIECKQFGRLTVYIWSGMVESAETRAAVKRYIF